MEVIKDDAQAEQNQKVMFYDSTNKRETVVSAKLDGLRIFHES